MWLNYNHVKWNELLEKWKIPADLQLLGDCWARYLVIMHKTTQRPVSGVLFSFGDDLEHVNSVPPGSTPCLHRLYPRGNLGFLLPNGPTLKCCGLDAAYDLAALLLLTAAINLLLEVPTLWQFAALSTAGMVVDIVCARARLSPDPVQWSHCAPIHPPAGQRWLLAFTFRRPSGAAFQLILDGFPVGCAEVALCHLFTFDLIQLLTEATTLSMNHVNHVWWTYLDNSIHKRITNYINNKQNNYINVCHI